ncbi:MAG: hypothetical protein BV459_06850 [Thermoplasmata archaeon M11B2D]|nr:MAG: hypothetical protein BV459_06850 [Thermoplasmata archaeon M11B2D]
MSADNGVYILLTKGPEFRVAHTQAIDNVYGEWSDDDNIWMGNPESILDTFGESHAFDNIEEAYDVAEILERSVEFTEYGVCLIRDFEGQTFAELIEGTKDGTSV